MSQADVVSGAVNGGSYPPVDAVSPVSAEPADAPSNATEQVVTDAVSDEELLQRVRQGVLATYAVLYQRHRRAAWRQARRLCRCGATADDLVSEAFADVLTVVLAGGGPLALADVNGRLPA